MPQKKPALGRGLEALLPPKQTKKEPTKPVAEEPRSEAPVTLPVSAIEPNPDQPRVTFDPLKMEELVDSVRRHGLIQPVAVMPGNREGRYVIVAGERRWRAATEAGLPEIPVIVLQKLEPRDLMEFALVENLQREDLQPLEEAQAYQSLQTRFNLTAEQIAERVGKRRSSIANSLRLLSLRPDMQEDLIAERITAGHARAILSLENPRDQIRLRDAILHGNLSVRQAEMRARQMVEDGAARTGKSRGSGASSAAKNGKEEMSEDIVRLRERLVDVLACRVNISAQAEGRGRIEIYYDSLDDLQSLLDALGISV